ILIPQLHFGDFFNTIDPSATLGTFMAANRGLEYKSRQDSVSRFLQMNEAGLFELTYSEPWGDGSMTEVQIRTLKDGTISLANDILAALHSELHGSLCLPGEAGYDEARTIWNAMIDRRPGAVVRCRAPSDVIGAVRLARENGLLVAVRGGGHNIAGNAVCDGGLLIDLSPMRSVHIDSKE